MLYGACVAIAATLVSPKADAQNAVDLRVGAWDRSVALERSGDREGARDVLLRAWGRETESYEVTARIAWLSLGLEEWDEAIAAYERARGLRGAGQEATDGLVTALCAKGSSRLEARDFAGARAAWNRAVVLSPTNGGAERGLALIGPASHVDPEIWFGAVEQRPTSRGWTGWAMFLHVPWQINDDVSVRAAYRHTSTESKIAVPGPGRMGRTEVATSQQDEFYGGFGLRFPYTAVDLLGLAVMPSEEEAAPGGHLRLRLGGRFGLDHQQTMIARETGWNHQTWPSLYAWLGDAVQLRAGARLTTDDVDRSVSATAALQLGTRPIWFGLDGHVGEERWAFDGEGLSMLAIPDETTMGGRSTLMVDLGDTWRLGLQGHVESTRSSEAETGMYWSASAGLQWTPAGR